MSEAIIKVLEGPGPESFNPVNLESDLKSIGIDFNKSGQEDILPLDRDKFYALFMNNPLDASQINKLGGYFNKGGLIMLSKKDGGCAYSLDDLKSMHEGLGKLIKQIEKSNMVLHSRFDIIKNGSNVAERTL